MARKLLCDYVESTMRLFTYFSAAFLLSACATGPLDQTGTFLPPEHERQLANAQLCCTSYGQIQFGKLKMDEEKSFALLPSSPVFQFPHGRSFLVGYELPAGAKTLLLKTLPVNMLYNRTGHVLVPAVVFLDEKKELSEIVRPSFVSRRPSFIGDSWAEGSVAVPSNAKFAIVVDAKAQQGLAWRDSDQRSGYLQVRSGPTGMGSVVISGR